MNLPQYYPNKKLNPFDAQKISKGAQAGRHSHPPPVLLRGHSRRRACFFQVKTLATATLALGVRIVELECLIESFLDEINV